MMNFNLLAALHHLEKTMPYTVYRLLVALGLGGGFLLAALIGVGTGYAIGSMASYPGVIASLGAMLGFIGWGAILRWQRGNLLFSVWAGHIAALVEDISGRSLPAGQAQIEAAKARVAERFGDAKSLLLLVDENKRSLAELQQSRASWRGRILAMTPPQLVPWLRGILDWPLSWVHEVILGYCIRATAQVPAAACRTGVERYAREYTRLMRNATLLTGVILLGWLSLFLLMLIPVGWLADALPFALGIWRYLLALLAAWIIKAAFLEPLALAALLAVFFEQSGDASAVEKNVEN